MLRNMQSSRGIAWRSFSVGETPIVLCFMDKTHAWAPIPREPCASRARVLFSLQNITEEAVDSHLSHDS